MSKSDETFEGGASANFKVDDTFSGSVLIRINITHRLRPFLVPFSSEGDI